MAQINLINIDEFKEYKNNAKIHNDYQLDLIARSIQEFGFINPVLIDEEKNVIAGHGRIEAAKRLKIEKLPALIIPGLTEIERRAYILADNKLSELAEWDNKLVATELKSLEDEGFNTSVTGFLYSDIDFSFLEEKEKKEEKAKEKNNTQICECPRCKCLFKKNEILQHGNTYENV